MPPKVLVMRRRSCTAGWVRTITRPERPIENATGTPRAKRTTKAPNKVRIIAPPLFRRTAERAWLSGSLAQIRDRKSVVSGKSVSVRVDLGGRRIIKQHKREHNSN